MRLIGLISLGLGISLMLLPIRVASAAPVNGFTGEFALGNWNIASNPSSANLVDTADAPVSVMLSNYKSWYSSGSGISFSKPHSSGVVTFSYTLNGVTQACPATYKVGNSVTVLSSGVSSASFAVDENQAFGFSLNGNNTPSDFACMSGSQETISFTVSNFKFTPNATPSGNHTVGQPYQGGIIAYVYQSGDPGYDSNATKGFVVSSVNVSSGEAWGKVKSTQGVFPCANAEGAALGDGATNTANIIVANASATGQYANDYAAKTASNFSAGGNSNWVLPSKDELKKIYDNKGAIDSDFTAAGGWYWSSTESACMKGGSLNQYPKISSHAYGMNFNTGKNTYTAGMRAFKGTANAVKAISYFSIP